MSLKAKRIVSMVLIVAMTVALLSVSAVAAPATKQFKGYTIFGDSITSGYSVEKEGNWDANLQPVEIDYGILSDLVPGPETHYSVQEIEGLRKLTDGVTYRVHGSYPDLIANGLGYQMPDDSAASYADLLNQGYYNLSLPALRSVEVRMMLDPSYAGDDISSDIWNIVQKDGYTLMQQKAKEYIAKSDVVTLSIGSNDVAVNCFIRALKVIEAAGADTQTLNHIRAAVAVGDYGTATSYLFEAAKFFAVFPAAVAAYIQGALTGSATFFQNWDVIVSKIHEINPNAKVYAVGFYNPFRNFHVTDLGDEYWLGLGHFFDGLLQSMNIFINSIASTKDTYTYVDVFDVEVIGMGTLLTGLIDGSYFKYILFDVHPTNKGHQQIAERVLKAMQADQPAPTPVPEPVEPGQPDQPDQPVVTGKYVDVPDTEWCKTFVDYVSDRGIMTGVTNTTFEPYSNLTRAQVATILYALEGKPDNTFNQFNDVVETAWYFAPVNWCAAHGIVVGTGNGNYEPNRDVTREELVTILRSYADYLEQDVSATADISGFADAASVQSWSQEPVQWAVATGLISGRPGNLIAPQGTASRAEMAVIMKNFCETYGK